MALEKYTTKEELIAIFDKNTAFLLSEKEQKIAIEALQQLDFPTPKQEDWRYTKLNTILKHPFKQATYRDLDQKTLDLFTLKDLEAYKLVFVNGFFIEELSDSITDKIQITSINEAKSNKQFTNYLGKISSLDNNLFSALNAAYAVNGALIYVPKNKVLDKPVHIINLTDGQTQKILVHTRNLIVLDENAQAEIITTYHSLSTNFTFNNIVNEIMLNENAKLDYNMLQGEGNETFQINQTAVLQKTYSRLKTNTITLCGMLVRNDLNVKIDAENCETQLNGLSLPDKKQHFDNNLFVRHAYSNCTSNQLYKSVVDNNATSVFSGKILVDQDAQKTDANQSNKNVLLTANATALSKPQLEIYADDVSCTHGSTTGQLDKESLFFMQTRGISKNVAQRLLLQGFVGDVIDSIGIKAFRNEIKSLIEARLSGEKEENYCIKHKQNR